MIDKNQNTVDSTLMAETRVPWTKPSLTRLSLKEAMSAESGAPAADALYGTS